MFTMAEIKAEPQEDGILEAMRIKREMLDNFAITDHMIEDSDSSEEPNQGANVKVEPEGMGEEETVTESNLDESSTENMNGVVFEGETKALTARVMNELATILPVATVNISDDSETFKEAEEKIENVPDKEKDRANVYHEMEQGARRTEVKTGNKPGRQDRQVWLVQKPGVMTKELSLGSRGSESGVRVSLELRNREAGKERNRGLVADGAREADLRSRIVGGGLKRGGPRRFRNLEDVTCYRCEEKGHFANKCNKVSGG